MIAAVVPGGRTGYRVAAASGPGQCGEKQVVAVEVEAHVAGLVWKTEKAVGDRVDEEPGIPVIESIKMEIPVQAPSAGVIGEIRIAEGERVEDGDVLVVLG